MTKEIIEMARQAGWSKEYLEFGDVRLERFAALVASAEREACANICKEMYLSGDMDTGLAEEAIQARGQA
jgi:hypothetical protein